MKALGLWLGLWGVALLPVSAQVTVEITQDQDQFLPAESVPTAVRITNRSGQSLHLGTGHGRRAAARSMGSRSPNQRGHAVGVGGIGKSRRTKACSSMAPIPSLLTCPPRVAQSVASASMATSGSL